MSEMVEARIYHPYTSWEDWQAGMWNSPTNLTDETAEAARILGEPTAFLPAARAMLADWTHAAEHNLTDPGQNRRSWVGQATCCHAAGVAELATRQAWWTLTEAQRDAANAVADQAIEEWVRERESHHTLFVWPPVPLGAIPDQRQSAKRYGENVA